MLLTFIRARLTRHDARVQLRVEDLAWGVGLPNDESNGRGAHIRAILIQSNTSAQSRGVTVFAQTGVGARGTNFDAGGQRLYNARVVFVVLQVCMGMTAQHGLD
jgi:hypothetical protein